MSGKISKFHPKNSWTREKTLEICKLFRENPILWNTSTTGYDKIKARESATKDILSHLEPYMPGLTLKDIRKKLHNLRSQYRKQLLTDQMRKRKGYPNSHQTSWCLKELDFLKPFFLKRNRISKFSNNTQRRVSNEQGADFQYSVEDFQPIEYYETKIGNDISVDKNDKEFKTRFAWLATEVDKTFKEIQSEKLKKAAMMAIQKALKYAKTCDRQQPQEATTTSNDDNEHIVSNYNMYAEHLETDADLLELSEEEESEIHDLLVENETSNFKAKSYFEWNHDMSIYNPDEISVKLCQNQIIISACHEKHEVSGLGSTRRNFKRTLELPNGCQDNIEATLSLDGILTVRAVESSMMDCVKEKNVIIQKI